MITHGWVAAGAALLLAVVWWDMIFDSQVLRHPTGTLPPDVLATTSSYYRRCTVDGGPMMYLPVVVMVLVLIGIVLELVRSTIAPWVGWASLILAAWGVVSVAFIAVPRAQRIGRAQESPDILSGLARIVFKLHAAAAVCWIVVIVLQLCVR
jgi:hypothetical protein